jgi:hypothetical protein
VLEVLFRVPSLSLPSSSLSGADRLPGSLPSSRRDRLRPLFSRVPKSSIRSVRRRSQPLDGFLRNPAPRACFIPQPRPGRFARSGGYLLLAAVVPSSRRPAPVPLFDGRSPGRILTATAGALGFEALFRAGARARRSWQLAFLEGAPLFEFRLFQDLISRRGSSLPRTSAHGVTSAKPNSNSRPCSACPEPPPAYRRRQTRLVRHRTSRPA